MRSRRRGSRLRIEDGSGDTTTAGFEEQDTPASGQAYFCLFRGSQGPNVGPGSYGTGSSQEQRVAASGDRSS